MQVFGRPLRLTVSIDLESTIISLAAILVSRTITFLSHESFPEIIAVLLSFIPIVIISFKITKFLEVKGVFQPESKSVKLSLAALFFVPVVYIPITILNYMTSSYVATTLILVMALTIFGEKLRLSRRLSSSLESFRNGITTDGKSILFPIQVLLFVFISTYLHNQAAPISPDRMDELHSIAFAVILIIPAYLLVTNAKLKYYSIIATIIFLFTFLALQDLAYYGGDTGLFISVTKHILAGGTADFVSIEDRWRFGSTTTLGLPTLSAYLSEASGLTPEIPIPFATSIGIIFTIIGGIVYAEFIGKSELEKGTIFFAYTLLQPSIYYFDLNVLRSASLLLLILPLIIPLFAQMRFNNLGKLSFIAAMFSLWIIHPLSLVIIIVMMGFFLRKIRWKGRVVLASLIIFAIVVVAISPPTARALSISPEELPKLTFKKLIQDQVLSPFPDFASSSWPGTFVQKISIFTTIAMVFIVIFAKDFPLPKFPVIGFLIMFFILSSFIDSPNFPIGRLAMFLATLGIMTISITIVRRVEIVKNKIRHLLGNKLDISLMIQRLGQVALLVTISFLVVMSSYPRDRALMLDSYSYKEYNFLKGFVQKEETNFDQSLILSHIETLRYLNGIDGSILYYNNAPKAFSIDFTDGASAAEHYSAFSTLLKGDLSNAKSWSAMHNVTSTYVVILYRLVPSGVNFNQGELITQDDVGMVRRIHFVNSLN